MIKNQSHKITLLILFAMAHIPFPSCANSPSQTMAVTLEYVKGGDLQEEKNVWVRAAKDAYKDIPLDVLFGTINAERFKTLDGVLEVGFEDHPIDLNNPDKNVFCVVAKNEEVVVGVILFEPTEQKNEVYIRELAVDPAMQRKGIGRQLMGAVQTTLPTTKKIVLTTNKANMSASNFYQKIGFVRCAQIHHGFNPERWIGFEKEIK